MQTKPLLIDDYKEFRIIIKDVSIHYMNRPADWKYEVSVQHCLEKKTFFGNKKFVWTEWCTYNVLPAKRLLCEDEIYFDTVQMLEGFLNSLTNEPFNARIDQIENRPKSKKS